MRRVLTTLLIGLAAIPSPAGAVLIHIEYTGEVSNSVGNAFESLLYSVDDPISGWFEFDTDDFDQVLPGYEELNNGPTNSNLTDGRDFSGWTDHGYAERCTPLGDGCGEDAMIIEDQHELDEQFFDSDGLVVGRERQSFYHYITWQEQNNPGVFDASWYASYDSAMLSSMDYAIGSITQFYDLESCEPSPSGGNCQFEQRLRSNVDFQLTSWKSVEVPEPGTLGLFGIGLAGMGLARRRKKV